MNCRKLILGSIFLTAALAAGIAQDTQEKTYVLSEIISEPYLSQLKKDKQIRFIHTEEERDFKLAPNTYYSQIAKNNVVVKDKGNLGFVTESLFLLDKKELAKNSKDGEKADTSLDAVARILRSISKMQGMKYYSRSDKKWNTLYSQAYMFKDPDNDEPIADQNTGNADGQVSYCFQKDHTFGPCKYKLMYFQSKYEVAAKFQSISYMMFGPIRAVKPGQFKMNIVVMDCGDQYLLYMTTDADGTRIGFMVDRLNDSFNARIDAIYKWFFEQF